MRIGRRAICRRLSAPGRGGVQEREPPCRPGTPLEGILRAARVGTGRRPQHDPIEPIAPAETPRERRLALPDQHCVTDSVRVPRMWPSNAPGFAGPPDPGFPLIRSGRCATATPFGCSATCCDARSAGASQTTPEVGSRSSLIFPTTRIRRKSPPTAHRAPRSTSTPSFANATTPECSSNRSRALTDEPGGAERGPARPAGMRPAPPGV
jgi:hypothetical protein